MRLSDILLAGIPSFQDVISATMMSNTGMPSVIYNPYGYTTLTVNDKKDIDQNKYTELVQSSIDNNDINILVNGLKEMGISMSGEVDGKQFGVQDQNNTNIKQFGKSVNTSSTNEIGGMGGDIKSPISYGTPEHVEIEVEYDPDELLKHIDKTFMYHTHPDMTDNNYHP